jgi:hypothetical protein
LFYSLLISSRFASLAKEISKKQKKTNKKKSSKNLDYGSMKRVHFRLDQILDHAMLRHDRLAHK